MKPTKIEFECGETGFSQRVTLEISHNISKVTEVSITKHAVSQRDDTQRVFGLSTENILKMADAIKKYESIMKS